MPLDQAGGRGLLADYLPLFWRAVVEGVQDYFDKYQEVAHVHRPTTKRSIMRDHIVDRLRALLDGMPGVKIRDENQTTYFGIEGLVRLLVKKADEDGSVELTKTQTSFEFQANSVQFHFDTTVIADVTNLYLSYVPSLDSPTLPPVFLICPCDDGWTWRIEIEPPPGAMLGEVGGGLPPAGPEDDLVRIPAKRNVEDE